MVVLFFPCVHIGGHEKSLAKVVYYPPIFTFPSLTSVFMGRRGPLPSLNSGVYSGGYEVGVEPLHLL